jgi:lipid II:glycine glycyltransferase (peptidoglycan interpeptide bridge formation enzyme)
MPILIIDPTTSPLWDNLAQSHHYSSIFHSPEWLGILARTYPFEIKAAIKTDTRGQAIAGLPYCIVDDIRGKRIVSIPFSDFSDALVQSFDEWQELLEPLLDEDCPIMLRCLHNNIPLEDKRFALAKQAKWHGIDLAADLDSIWAALHPSARRAIRKSETMGIRVRTAEDGELREFFNLHLQLRKYKYQLLAQPYCFFENIWKTLVESQKGLILLAEYEGKVIGAIVYLAWKDVFTYKFSASHQEELQARPTDILLWEAVKYAKALDYKYLDLGLSDWEQEGLLRFKRKYASEEKAISFLRYEPPNYSPPEDKIGSTLSCLTDLFTRLDVPDKVTEEAGNQLYRYFV